MLDNVKKMWGNFMDGKLDKDDIIVGGVLALIVTSLFKINFSVSARPKRRKK